MSAMSASMTHSANIGSVTTEFGGHVLGDGPHIVATYSYAGPGLPAGTVMAFSVPGVVAPANPGVAPETIKGVLLRDAPDTDSGTSVVEVVVFGRVNLKTIQFDSGVAPSPIDIEQLEKTKIYAR